MGLGWTDEPVTPFPPMRDTGVSAPAGPPPLAGVQIRTREQVPLLDTWFLSLRVPDTCLVVGRFGGSHWILAAATSTSAAELAAEVEARPASCGTRLVVSMHDTWAQHRARAAVAAAARGGVAIDTHDAPLMPCVRAVRLVAGDGRLWVSAEAAEIVTTMTRWDGGHNADVRPVMALGQLLLCHDGQVRFCKDHVWKGAARR